MSLNASSSLDEWLSYLESLHPKEIDLGLERVLLVANQMNLFSRLSQLKSKIVTVAGTNGKGSCVATLEHLMLAAQVTVGTYTSPHFLDYNERIRINGENASDKKIVTAFDEIEKARGDVRLTYFEFGTLAALWLFIESKVDIVVLEVGLGGRLDAVNAFDPDISIVTSVALDHQDWLGNDRETIGREKAGIFRKDRPAICVDIDPPKTVINYAHEIDAKLLSYKKNIEWKVDSDKNLFSWQGVDQFGRTISIESLPVPQLPVASVAAALQAVVLLGFDLFELPLEHVLSKLALTGRSQKIIIDDKKILLDVAHNPAAAEHLKQMLAKESAKRIVAVFAVMADKDYVNIFKHLSDEIDCWYVSGIPGVPRAETGNRLGATLLELGLEGRVCDTVLESLTMALSSITKEDLVVVLGSFYTVAAILESQ